MTDIAAAMGVVHLRQAERMRSHRAEIARMFSVAFSDIPQLEVPAHRPDCLHSWHLFLLRLRLDRLTADRARFVESLNNRKTDVSLHFILLHLHAYYRDLYGYKREDFPVAFGEFKREISLLISSRKSDKDVCDMIDAVADIVSAQRP